MFRKTDEAKLCAWLKAKILKLRLVLEKSYKNYVINLRKMLAPISGNQILFYQSLKQLFLSIHVFGMDVQSIADYLPRERNIGSRR